MTDEILKRVDALAAKLGVATNHIWAILVRQARVEAVTDIITALISFGVFAACVYGVNSMRRWTEDEKILPMCGVGIIGIIALIIAVTLVNASVTELLNPEYFALKQILPNARP